MTYKKSFYLLPNSNIDIGLETNMIGYRSIFAVEMCHFLQISQEAQKHLMRYLDIVFRQMHMLL